MPIDTQLFFFQCGGLVLYQSLFVYNLLIRFRSTKEFPCRENEEHQPEDHQTWPWMIENLKSPIRVAWFAINLPDDDGVGWETTLYWVHPIVGRWDLSIRKKSPWTVEFHSKSTYYSKETIHACVVVSRTTTWAMADFRSNSDRSSTVQILLDNPMKTVHMASKRSWECDNEAWIAVDVSLISNRIVARAMFVHDMCIASLFPRKKARWILLLTIHAELNTSPSLAFFFFSESFFDYVHQLVITSLQVHRYLFCRRDSRTTLPCGPSRGCSSFEQVGALVFLLYNYLTAIFVYSNW
jgi:hypothetical protein